MSKKFTPEQLASIKDFGDKVGFHLDEIRKLMKGEYLVTLFARSHEPGSGWCITMETEDTHQEALEELKRTWKSNSSVGNSISHGEIGEAMQVVASGRDRH